MKKDFKVVTCDRIAVMRDVEVDGEKHSVPVRSVVVQLAPVLEDGTGTIKVIAPLAEMEYFKVGETVPLTFGDFVPPEKEEAPEEKAGE